MTKMFTSTKDQPVYKNHPQTRLWFRNFTVLCFLWLGSIPYDGVPNKETVTVHPAVTSIYIILALGGIVFAIVCLIFNFIYRNEKLVKLASAKLNFLIGAGAIILYLDTVFFVIPTTSPSAVLAFCNLTPWLTAIGYSLCYGTILAKMARVYYIFNNPSPKKKRIKDRFLVLAVISLVVIDLMILITYTLVEGLRGSLVVQEVSNRERPMITEGTLGIITEYCIYICNSTARNIFLGILYGYKMLLQIIALLLAFSIRKVKVKGLNDAKYIGAAIYVTSIVLAVIIVAIYTLKDAINGFAALFCTGFIIGTTVILVLVFVPLMIGLYTDPKGDDIFKKSGTATSGVSKDSEYKYTETEMQGLRRRIKDLEDQVEKQEQTSKNKKEPPHPSKSEAVLHALESSHMIDKQQKTDSGTIWDTEEEKEPDNETTM